MTPGAVSADSDGNPAAPARIMPDPPLRADGRCAECRGERKTAGLAPVYRKAAELDPFCSAPCARAWHGHPLPAGHQGRREGR